MVRKHLLFLIFLFIIIFSRISFLSKEYAWEEPLVVNSVKNVVKYGFPYYYGGEQYNDKTIISKGYPDNTNSVNLGKPPFFLFLISFPFKIFNLNFSELVFRAVLFGFQLILFIFFYFFSTKFFKSRFLACLGVLIISLSPFMIQLSTQLAIDGTVLTLFLFLLYLFIDNIPAFFIIFFLNFGIRHETTLFFLISFITYFLIGKKFKKALLILLTGLSSIAVYFIFFYFYTLRFDKTLFLVPTEIIRGVFNSFFYPKMTHLDNNLFSGGIILIKRFITWTSPFFIILYLISLLIFSKKSLLWHIIILINFLTFFVIGWTGHFIPRYFAPVIPFMTLAIVDLLRESKKIIKISVFFLILSLLIWQVKTNLNNSRKPYSFTSLYGNYGFRQAGEYLKNKLNKDDIVVTIDAIGYYYERKYYDWYETYSYPNRLKNFSHKFKDKNTNIVAVALPKQDMQSKETDFFEIDEKNYDKKVFGTIEIYIKK